MVFSGLNRWDIRIRWYLMASAVSNTDVASTSLKCGVQFIIIFMSGSANIFLGSLSSHSLGSRIFCVRVWGFYSDGKAYPVER